MSVVFTDEVEALPASAPVDRPHIIDIDHFLETFSGDGITVLKLWDALATFLFKLSPETLRSFLDPNTISFKLTHHPDSPYTSKMIIWRRSNELMVGQYTAEELNGDYLYQRDNLIRCKIDGNGAWKVVTASCGVISEQNMDYVWNGLLVDTGMFTVIKAQDDGLKREFAEILGRGILTNGLWEKDFNRWDIEVKVKVQDKDEEKGENKDEGTTESANSSEAT